MADIEQIKERAKYGRRQNDISPPKSNFFAELWWLDIYLGHGRMLETALVFVEFQYAAMLICVPPIHIVVLALEDLHVATILKALPFLISATISFAGLCLNAAGYEISKWFRVVGATFGMGLWTFILIKNVYLGYFAAGVNPWCTMGILGSLWIIRRGLMGLPKPGSAGSV